MNHIPRTLCAFLCTLVSCTSSDNQINRQAVIIAVDRDIDSFNPLFAEEVVSGEINDLIFPALVGSVFDESTGTLEYTPMLARSWEFSDDRSDVTFRLVGNAVWSDGHPVTSRDIQMTYELYADPVVASVRQFAVEYLEGSGDAPDIRKSVEVVDDSTVVFHFIDGYSGQLFDAGLPILPAHVYGIIPPEELRTHPVNKSPVGAGPFMLESWTPLQEVVLVPNPTSVLPYPARLPKLIFRVIADPQSRLAQLRSGELDLVTGLRPEDAAALTEDASTIQVVSTAGRDYDFIGWNNIDPKRFGTGEVAPHPLFGSASVRRALTMAVNREEILQAYLKGYGQEAIGGVSPLFKWAYNAQIRPLPFDPEQARTALAEEGWRDSNGNGIVDRDGREFSFTLKLASGNQLRSALASTVQQQLRRIKVEAKIEQAEGGTFWEDLMARRYDAWIAGFSVPLQMYLADLWGSDLERYPFNLAGFQNARVDEILSATAGLANETDGAALWKEFQAVVHDQQPYTFLFWIDNIVGIQDRVQGTDIGVLGTTHMAWNWHLKESGESDGSAE